MAQRTLFPIIGRHDEVSQLTDIIEEKGSRRIVCMSGSGGIGKTRLLQEIHRLVLGKIEKKEGFLCSGILDFDNPFFHSLHNLGHEIATQLDESSFKPYQENISAIRKMEIGGISPQKIAEETIILNHTFTTCFNALSSDSRVVLLFDTTDALRGQNDIWQFWADVFPLLENCVLLIAGRDARQIGQTLQAAIDIEDVYSVEVAPLEFDDCQKYLHQKLQQMYTILEPELAEKLILIAHGKPILLDLAVEWQARNIPLSWLIESNLDELQALSNEQREQWQEEFELHLVRHIANVRHAIDRLILILSRIYPLDIDMISALLKASTEEARRLFEEAQPYVFMKLLPDGRLTLHDEMRRMVNKHVWNIVDPEFDRRKRDSSLAAGYFQQKIHQLAERIHTLKSNPETVSNIALTLAELEETQELFIKRNLTHTLEADLASGFDLYTQAIGKARHTGRTKFAKQLENVVQPHIAELPLEQQYEYRVLHGRLLNDLGDTQHARTLFQQLLQENEGKVEREADIYNALATSEIQLGNFNLALEYQQKCYDILNWLNKKNFIPNVANQIGYIYRLKGELQNSIHYYRIAMDAALHIENPGKDIVASVLNNLGYVHGLEGKYNEGKTYCEKAINLWLEDHLLKRVGQGEITLASIFRNRGQYKTAIDFLKKALQRFEEPEDSLWLVRANLQLGWTYWYEGIGQQRRDSFRVVSGETIKTEIERMRRQRSLNVAATCFEKSLQLAEAYHIQAEIPIILGQFSRLCWERDEKEKARRLSKEAFELSRKMHNLHQAIDSLVAMAEFDYAEDKFKHIPEYAALLQKDYESKGDYYPLFFGRMRRILADIAYATGDHDMALKYYAEGLGLIKLHGGYNVYSIIEELNALSAKINTLPPVTAYKWVEFLKDYWGQQQPVEIYKTLLIWCDLQVVGTKFR